MPGRRSKRPPPGETPGGTRRWRRSPKNVGGTSARKSTAARQESPAAAEQERLITEALGRLRDVDVREVMTPRVDVIALTIPVRAEDVARAVRESGHSCFPVVNDGLDNVVGVLYVNDLFRTRRSGRGDLLLEGPTRDLANPPSPSSATPAPAGESPVRTSATANGQQLGTATPGNGQPAGTPTPGEERTASGSPSPLDISRRVRQAYVIPESQRILDALVDMRAHRRAFAVVVDEYGGVAGVLTVKDLLEPIVGDLRDEFDPVNDEPLIVRVDASRWLVDGRASVDEVRERLGIDLHDGDYVTLGGYLFDGFGHIPQEGESLRVDGWDLVVQEMDRRRVAKVVAHRLPAYSPDANGQSDATAGAAAAGTARPDAPPTPQSPEPAAAGRQRALG